MLHEFFTPFHEHLEIFSVSVVIAALAGILGGMLVSFSFPVSHLAGIAAGFGTVCVIAILIALLVRFMQLLLIMKRKKSEPRQL